MRDATRGGVATILNEIARAADVGVLASEDAIPVRDEVRGACELLGIDPMYVACEGRMVAVVPGDSADLALRALRGHPLGAEAAVIGQVVADQPGIVRLKTSFGGTQDRRPAGRRPAPPHLLTRSGSRGCAFGVAVADAKRTSTRWSGPPWRQLDRRTKDSAVSAGDPRASVRSADTARR